MSKPESIASPPKIEGESASFQEREIRLKELEFELRRRDRWRIPLLTAFISAIAAITSVIIANSAAERLKERELAEAQARLTYEILAGELKQYYEAEDYSAQRAVLDRLEFYHRAGLIKDPSGLIRRAIIEGDLVPPR